MAGDIPTNTMERRPREAKGNMALLVLVDSSKAYADSSIVDEAICVALEHFGMPYRIFDLAHGTLTKEVIASSCGVVIAQEHLGESLSLAETQAIVDALTEGIGVVNFDGDLRLYKPPLLAIFGFAIDRLPFASDLLRICDNSHYITWTQESGALKRLKQPAIMYKVTNFRRDVTVLAEGLLGKDQLIFIRHLVPGSAYEPGHLPVVFATTYGQGRAVQFAVTPRIWLSGFFGHAFGLDDIFWKSIVWVARKPFVMQAMPPFVTMRIDDASGRHDFRYIDVINKHGYIPHVSLFLDDVSDEVVPFLRGKCEAGEAEFDTHALSYYKLLYFDFGVGEYSVEELRKLFEREDERYRRWGFRPSKTVHAHWGEVGVRSLPFLKARGRTFLGAPYLLGQLKCGRLKKGWRPYSLNSFFYDYVPEDQDFYTIGAYMPREEINPDFLAGCTTWLNEKPFNDLEEAARRGAQQLKLGLDSLFFGELLTHEQKFTVLSLEEIDRILTLIANMTNRHDKIFKSHDHIAEYMKSRDESRIVRADYDPKTKEVNCVLSGKATLPLQIYVFRNEGEGVEYRFEEVPVFEGTTTKTFPSPGPHIGWTI